MTDEKRLKKRLFPLFLAVFCHGFVFWYVIEKLFMQSIGFTDSMIGIFVAVYSVVVILSETPSGILADRWSRKGVLIVASIALGLSALIGGLSSSPTVYVLSVCMWAIYYALYTGTYDSVLYDTILEEGVSTKRFEYFLGRMKAIDSFALVTGSLVGGVIVSYFGMRSAYFLTAAPALLAVLSLALFREPTLHKASQLSSVSHQVRQTFAAVTRSRVILPTVAVLLAATTILYIIFEFDQLWFIALNTPLSYYGPINAVLLSSIAIGGFAVSKLKLSKLRRMAILLGLTVLCVFSLVYSRNVFVILASLLTICVALIAIEIVFTKVLHDNLHSKIRSGASSAVSTLGRGFIVPLSVMLGYLAESHSIFKASWLIVGLVMGLVVLTILAYLKTDMDSSNNKSAVNFETHVK
jgi:MFS family permease